MIWKTITIIIASIVMYRNVLYNGWDFRVFWEAARLFWEGGSPYLAGLGTGWVFKYPPWIFPVFIPFGLLSVDLALGIWAFIQVLCLLWVLKWVGERCQSKHAWFVTFLLYWPVFHYHGLSGQISLPMLALALKWVQSEKPGPSRLSFVFVTFSAKVFSLLSLVLFWRQLLKLKTVFWIVFLSMVLSFPALSTIENFNFFDLMLQWASSAGSGGEKLGFDVVRGRVNQGLPALLLRLMNVPPERVLADLLVFFFIAFGMALFLLRAQKVLSFDERWSAWLAVGVICLPLAWFHSFVLAFPLAAISLDRSIISKDHRLIAVSLLGIVFSGVVTRGGLHEVGHFFELLSVKSIGVVFSLGAIFLTKLGDKLIPKSER